MSASATKYPNNTRTVSGTVNVTQDDVLLLCDTSTVPAVINLQGIPAKFWNTIYKLYVFDKSNNAGTHNITINAPNGFLINGQSSLTLSVNGAGAMVRIGTDTMYIAITTLAIGGAVTLATVNTSSVTLTLSPGPNYVLQADVNLNDSLSAGKLLTNTPTKYFPKVTSEDIYGSYPSNKIAAWDSKSGTGNFAGAADFDLTSGTWTCPSTGHYLITMLLGYKLNSSGIASKQSDNPNTNGQYWMLSASDMGFISMGMILNNGSNLVAVESKPMSQKVGALYITEPSSLFLFTAGQVLNFALNNYTDLDIYGQSNSTLIIRILKIGN